ncbi:DUF397 domain-containing protein [Actinophytocola sediminis]
MTSIRWRKSSYSGNQGDCVELAHTLDTVRDSKNPAGPMVRTDLSSLLRAVRAGRLTRR